MSVPNSLDTDQDRHWVSPNLGLICLPRFSVDDTSMQRGRCSLHMLERVLFVFLRMYMSLCRSVDALNEYFVSATPLTVFFQSF